MIRHQDVTHQGKLIARPDLTQNFHDDVSIARGSQEFAPLIARERDEVQIALANTAFEMVRHRSRAERPTLENHKGRPPGLPNANAVVISFGSIRCSMSQTSKGCATRGGICSPRLKNASDSSSSKRTAF